MMVALCAKFAGKCSTMGPTRGSMSKFTALTWSRLPSVPVRIVAKYFAMPPSASFTLSVHVLPIAQLPHAKSANGRLTRGNSWRLISDQSMLWKRQLTHSCVVNYAISCLALIKTKCLINAAAATASQCNHQQSHHFSAKSAPKSTEPRARWSCTLRACIGACASPVRTVPRTVFSCPTGRRWSGMFVMSTRWPSAASSVTPVARRSRYDSCSKAFKVRFLWQGVQGTLPVARRSFKVGGVCKCNHVPFEVDISAIGSYRYIAIWLHLDFGIRFQLSAPAEK